VDVVDVDLVDVFPVSAVVNDVILKIYKYEIIYTNLCPFFSRLLPF
jgi:hypothetical protein